MAAYSFKECFIPWLKDGAKTQNIIKIATIGYGYFKDQNDKVAIQFLFTHAGHSTNYETPPKKRIWLSSFPLKNLIKEIKPLVINGSVTILANANIYEYALTYIISVNQGDQSIECKIAEKPLAGESFITDEEIDGIIDYY